MFSHFVGRNCETFAISWVSIARPRFFVKGFDKFSERLRLFFPFSVAGNVWFGEKNKKAERNAPLGGGTLDGKNKKAPDGFHPALAWCSIGESNSGHHD